MRRYRVAVGRKDNIKPGNVLGAIANEAEISSTYIGAIQIFQDFTTVDLPDEMPKETLQILKNTRVFDKKLNIEELNDSNNITSPREKSHNFKRQPSKRKGNVKARRNRNRNFSRSKTTR
jgi:ATP-dependent RNA helicase DeaD